MQQQTKHVIRKSIFSPRSRPGRTGTWAVIAMLVLGIGAGTIAVTYWQARTSTDSQGGTLGRGLTGPNHVSTDAAGGSAGSPPQHSAAGSAQWDEATASVELAGIQQSLNQTALEHKPAQPVIDAAMRLVERYPRYADARTLLAQAYLYESEHQLAYEQLTLSLDLEGQQAEVEMLAGTVAMSLRRPQDAVAHYRAAIGLDPKQVRHRLYLAQAYSQMGQFDDARTVALGALRVDSTLPEAYAMLADIYAKQGKLSLAITQMDRAIQYTRVSDSANTAIYTRRKAQLLRRDNQPEQALIVLANLTREQSPDPLTLEDMALCWSMLGQADRAAAVFESALQVDPTSWVFAARAAHWSLVADDPVRARRHIDTLRRINPRADVLPNLEARLNQPPKPEPDAPTPQK